MNLRPPGYEPDELPTALLRDIELGPVGAGDRTRTGTVLLPGDFKSPVSTIPPHRRILARIRIPHSCGIVNTLAQYFCPSTKLGPLLPFPSVSKSLAEFAARRRQKFKSFFTATCAWGKIPLRLQETASVEFLRGAGCNPFAGKIQRIFRQRKTGAPEARDPQNLLLWVMPQPISTSQTPLRCPCRRRCTG